MRYIQLSYRCKRLSHIRVFFWLKGKDKAVPQHTYGGAEGEDDLGTRWGVSGKRHAPAALCTRENDRRYQLYRRLGGPRAGLDTEIRGKICCLCRKSTLDLPVVKP
jgi:hypothetical protein